MFLRALAALAALFLVSCGSARLPMPSLTPYRIEIQQGNFVSQEMVSQLKLGMSKDQVRFVLGTPLITDGFHAERWDYVFRRQRVNSNELEQRKFAVFFEGGKLKRIEGDVTSAAKPDAQMAPASLTAPGSGPAVRTASDAAEPAQAAVPEKPAAAPVSSGNR